MERSSFLYIPLIQIIQINPNYTILHHLRQKIQGEHPQTSLIDIFTI